MTLLELKDIRRSFVAGDKEVVVLDNINIEITAGEMVAIVGASGSGKSTLLNILGCLDKPTSGEYRVQGRNTLQLNHDDLAQLRREYFGFIFQRYHLLNTLTALHNVQMPAVYAGIAPEVRHAKAQALLTRLGLGEKSKSLPHQLSGGQQQRVSIARALMNGGQIILADEPTGALDSQSGKEVLAILNELHQQGHTIIMVTHDPAIAAHAERIIEIADGRIIGDRHNAPTPAATPPQAQPAAETIPTSPGRVVERLMEAFKMALMAMNGQRLRTFLTMLGIVIGITSVVSVLALGEGSRQKILADIQGMGTKTLDLYPGASMGDRKAGQIKTLRPEDASAISAQYYVKAVSPTVANNALLRFKHLALTGNVTGVNEDYFTALGYELRQGSTLSAQSMTRLAQEAVIDRTTEQEFFGDDSAIGQILWVARLPMRIIGVVENKKTMMGRSANLNVWIPYTTALHKLLGQSHLRNITVRIHDEVDSHLAQSSLENLITARHGQKDFFIFNSDAIRETIESTTAVLQILITLIALISLVVGGIGVMNIMLVSVTERTREIGIRMAVGARSSDIMQQFLIEAVLVCLMAGTLGVGIALLLGWIFGQLVDSFQLIYSPGAIVGAFLTSSVIGFVFGFFPARRAALLDPIQALERE